MRLRKTITFLFLLNLTILSGILTANGQAEESSPESFEAILYILVDAAGERKGSKLPGSFDPVIRDIRGNFGVQDLLIADSLLGRLSTSGSLDVKAISNAFGTPKTQDHSSFVDWRLTNLRRLQSGGSGAAYSFQSFSFVSRIPFALANAGNDVSRQPINYETLNLTLNRLSVQDDKPSLIGVLSQPKPGGNVYLVLKVRKLDK